MSSATDPADPQGPGLPRDPADYGPRRRGLGFAFWAMIAVSIFLILAGFTVGRFGARLFPLQTAVRGQTGQTPTLSGGGGATPSLQPVGAMAAQSPASKANPIPPAADVAALGARLDRLQADQQRAARAAGEALAAAALSAASQTSRRFDNELGELDQLLPDTTDLRALRALAETGAPTRPALAATFIDAADRAVVAAKTPPPGSGVVARVVHALASVFTVRRVDRLTGDSPDAILARAQRAVDAGDLEAALAHLDRLPPAGADALSGWRSQASRRIEIDRRVADIRAAAVRDLVATKSANP